MRTKIVKEARSWIGTPFHMHGRLKNIGCDCIGLILGVAQKLNLQSKQNYVLPHFDHLNYNARESSLKLEYQLNTHLKPSVKINIADIVLLEFDSTPRHVGLVGDYNNNGFSIIHANIRLKKVVEHELDESLTKRIVGIYSFNECEE